MIGPRVLLAGGALITAAGLIWISGLPTHSAYPLHVLGPTVVAGFGISCMLLSVTVAATSGVDPENAGSASGLITTSRQIGGALGLAVLTSIADFAALGRDRRSDRRCCSRLPGRVPGERRDHAAGRVRRPDPAARATPRLTSRRSSSGRP